MPSVVVLRGSYENFQKSLCNAIESGRFLWGLENEWEFRRVLECRDCIFVLYVTKTFF
jgi:hypothetical protein